MNTRVRLSDRRDAGVWPVDGALPTAMPSRVILIRFDAPAKPARGEPCNGCGWCCSAEPCPLGTLLSRRRRGRCRALRWSPSAARYQCGAIAEPQRWLPRLPGTWAAALVRRWIAVGIGCDADLAGEIAAARP